MLKALSIRTRRLEEAHWERHVQGLDAPERIRRRGTAGAIMRRVGGGVEGEGGQRVGDAARAAGERSGRPSASITD